MMPRRRSVGYTDPVEVNGMTLTAHELAQRADALQQALASVNGTLDVCAAGS
jgi:hypothetical protein